MGERTRGDLALALPVLFFEVDFAHPHGFGCDFNPLVFLNVFHGLLQRKALGWGNPGIVVLAGGPHVG
jgi:hypothetical protein